MSVLVDFLFFIFFVAVFAGSEPLWNAKRFWAELAFGIGHIDDHQERHLLEGGECSRGQ